VALALNAGSIGLKEAPRRAEIQCPPPPTALPKVIPRAAPPAVRAAIPLAIARSDRHHDRAVLLVDRLEHRLL